MSLILGHMAYVIRNGRNDASLLNYDIELLAIYDVLLTLVTVVWQKYPEHLTRMTGTLCDGGLFRIYDNYIEIDKLRFFGSVEGTEIVHRNDITSV